MNEVLNIRATVEYSSPVVNLGDLPRKGPVAIHWYRPSQPLINWWEFANFDRKLTEGFIAQGYQETLRHDCKTAGCTLTDSWEAARFSEHGAT
jgi:hypothetical protein